MRTRSLASLTLLFPLLGACAVDSNDELDFDQLGDEPRAAYPPLPDEDTPLAYGMLRVANELDFDQLDVDVALDRRSAESIIAHRAGSDGALGTADDQYVRSLAELDSLYWLGAANLWRIQNYAQIEDYVPAVAPPATCDPALADTIEQCLRFVEDAAVPVSMQGALGWAPYSADLRPSCLEASEASYPSTDYFADGGIVGYLDPVLGHYGLMCDGAPEPLCDQGVAAVASAVMPECDAHYDVEPVLVEHGVDAADQADWDAALAALNASCGSDCSYWLRVYEYEPGMTPTLLGDVMGQTLSSASIEFQGPWLEREASDALPPMNAGAQALVNDVIADLSLGGASYDVGTAAEEIPCPNCHIFHDSFVLMFRDARIVVVVDVDTFWDS